MKGMTEMHIVFVTTELATVNNSSGGLASFTANIARIFAAKGHKITILLVTTKEENPVFDENIDVETVFVRKTVWNRLDSMAKICAFGRKEESVEIRKFFVNIYKSGQVRKRIDEINKTRKVDIVHFCNLNAVAFRANPNIPYVIRLSDIENIWRGADQPQGNISYTDIKLNLREKLDKHTLEKADYIISPSNLLADIYNMQLGLNITVIESPFVLNGFHWDYCVYDSVIADKKYILHYGSLKYLKGTHIVAQIAKEFLRMYPNLYLVLAGRSGELLDENGNKIKADELVKKNAGEFADRVIYAGRLAREQLYPLIQNAELCLLPSRIENLSNACIEAMAMGKIVIGTDGASFEQLIDDRISGFLCERDNPESYLQALSEVMAMGDEERNLMVVKASERIKMLNPDIIYEKYLAYYQKTIAEWRR